MTLEIGVSIFVAVLTLAIIAATWHGRAKRAPIIRELEEHYESLDGAKRVHLRAVPRERNPTPRVTAKATRKR